MLGISTATTVRRERDTGPGAPAAALAPAAIPDVRPAEIYIYIFCHIYMTDDIYMTYDIFCQAEDLFVYC